MKLFLYATTLLIAVNLTSCHARNENKKDLKGPDRIFEPNLLGSAESIIELDIRDHYERQLVQPEKADNVSFIYRCLPKICPEMLNVTTEGLLVWNGQASVIEIPKSFDLIVTVEYSLLGRNYSTDYEYVIWPGRYVYQNGDHWSSTKIAEISGNEDLAQLGRVVGHGSDSKKTHNFGTAFYLGEFSGNHLVATVKHVAKSDRGIESCDSERTVVFDSIGVTATCKENLFTTSPYDFIIMSVVLSDESKAALLKESVFKLNRNLTETFNHRLVVAGFGRFRSLPGELHFSFDDDCRSMSDFDLRPTNNIENYPVVACDASPGDSGAPILDLDRREIIGLVQGATSSKLPRVASIVIQDFLSNKVGNSEDIGRTVYIPTSYVLNDLQAKVDSHEITDRSLIELLEANK